MLKFQLVSIDGTKYDDDAYEVILPAQGGSIAVFEDHMPLISAAQPGVISVRQKQSDKDGDMKQFAVSGGILEVDGKTLRFLTDDVTAPEDISEKEAENALTRAEGLVSGAGTQQEVAEAHRVLVHSRARLQVAKMRRRHHS